ncbi:MAG: hypothetical protein IPM59_14405 [Chloracidobacterium sp.]|nr:hypothetical protein [Chloracidobacterium sp.]
MENSGKSALGLDANVAAGLAYIPICLVGIVMSIIIIATDKTNKLARFHAFQSLLLMALSIVLYLVVGLIVGVAAAADSGALALLGSLLYFVVLLGILGAVIFCCIKAFMGQIVKLPVIGNMADNWSN